MSFEFDEKRGAKAFDAAVKYLASSPHSAREVRERLYKKGYHKDEVEYAVNKAIGYRYIDDETYAKSFAESYCGRYGRNKIEYRLIYEKGVDKELASNVVAEVIDDDRELDESYKIASKYAAAKKFDRIDSKKVGAYLYQKGYANNIITATLDKLFNVDNFDC